MFFIIFSHLLYMVVTFSPSLKLIDLNYLLIVQVKQLHDWLAHWHEQFLDTGIKKKGNKSNNSGAKKAVLLSGTPGIGKTTSAKLVSQMLGFQAIEVLYYAFKCFLLKIIILLSCVFLFKSMHVLFFLIGKCK